MATITLGAKVTHDESSGLQNFTATPDGPLGGDFNDNDISISALITLNSIFATRLTALGVAPNTALGAALSGYTGVVGNAGSDAFTITGVTGTVTDIKFAANAQGGAFTGQDSDLDTAAGVSVFLYADPTNNNILLGRAGTGIGGGTADPNGAIVFAAHIEQTATGGKLWMVQYQPLRHGDASDFDDPVDLTGKVFIGVDQDMTFDLAGAPSGQNLFLMFTTANPTVGADGRIAEATIIATGKDPANQSTGVNISTGDTINTSQAGGPTTFGTNSQMITEQEGVRFTFVTGALENVTIPNLNQTEADLESNIDFTGMFNARSATFTVVQLQSGKSAQVKITALNTAVESGANFIDGYGNDATVAITNVIVRNAAGAIIENSDGTVNSAGIVITLSGGTALITGVLAGHRIEYTTTGEHNRVLIENGAALNASGNNHADFDIGGFRLLQTTVATLQIGQNMVFEDDGPSTSLDPRLQAGPTLTVDETTLLTDGTGNLGALSGYFTQGPPVFGSDSGTTVESSYALALVDPNGADSGLMDVATGANVLLYLEGGQVVGRAGSAGGAIVFTFSLDTATGGLALDQQRALQHPDAGDPDDTVTYSLIEIIKIDRTDTITDADGDQASTTATTLVSLSLEFKDDGPSITVNTVGTPDALTVDETVLADNATASFADNFGRTSSFGADAAGTLNDGVYALSVKSTGVDSGLDDVATGADVLLYLEGGQVVGRAGSAAGAIVFTVSVSATGTVTLDQQLAIKHPVTTNPDDSLTLAAADLIGLTRTDTITDRDGDSATSSATVNIGQALNFEDDGPSLSFDNLVGTGTINPQYGFWTSKNGTDLPGTLDVEMTGFDLVSPGGVVTSLTTFTFAQSATPGLYEGSMTADFDNNTGTDDTTVDFTLTVAADGSYALDLEQGFGSTTTLSSADGSLDAGGPDPVRTLTIGDEQIVFFAANPLAPTGSPPSAPPGVVDPNSILAGVGLGESDPTEADLQTTPLPSFIGNSSMNVSTSGIGVGNNVFQGDTSAAITAVDESFVINPESPLTAVKVYIDNSVAGYNTATEDLYFRIYYVDGSVSTNPARLDGLYSVEAGDLTAEAGGQVSFTIEAEGGKMIDAVQLVMGRGTIKIPVIEFVTATENLASDVKLDFSATLTDADGDSAISAFAADLFANELAGSLIDYTLIGTAADADAFNIDLPADEDVYRVEGFDAGDKIVLLGDAGATFVINFNDTDSIVTITESDGATTTVTVVGVNVPPLEDVVHGGI